MSSSTVAERSGVLGTRIGWIAGIGGALFFLFSPTTGLDPAQRGVAATTALTAAMWLTGALPVGAASLIPAAMLPLLGVLGASQVAPTYMSDIVLLFVGAFMLALGLERWGVHKRIALAIVHRVGTSPRRVVLGFMVSSAFLSMWISNTATTLLMLPIAMAVLTTLECEGEGNSLALCLLLGIAYSASIGGTATLVGTAPNMAFLQVFGENFESGPVVSFGEWLRNWFPLAVLFVPLAWLLMTRWLAPVPAAARNADDEIAQARAALGPMTRGQIGMSIMFFGTALLWVTRGNLELGFVRLPGWSNLFSSAIMENGKSMITDTTVALAMAILCFAIPVRTESGAREFLLDWRTAVKLPWEIILLFGGGLCLAKGFGESGLARVLGETLSPLLEGHATWVIVFATALFLSFLTEVTSNTATTFVLLPVAAQGAVAAGINPVIVMMPATVAASLAFMMPVATPPNAIVFSSRRFELPSMARVGFVLNMLGVVLLTLVFEFWIRPIAGIPAELPAWGKP